MRDDCGRHIKVINPKLKEITVECEDGEKRTFKIKQFDVVAFLTHLEGCVALNDITGLDDSDEN